METWAGLASLYFLACSRVLSDCSADWSLASRSRWTRYPGVSFSAVLLDVITIADEVDSQFEAGYAQVRRTQVPVQPSAA